MDLLVPFGVEGSLESRKVPTKNPTNKAQKQKTPGQKMSSATLKGPPTKLEKLQSPHKRPLYSEGYALSPKP